MPPIDELLQAAHDAQMKLQEARQLSRDEAIGAIRAIERAMTGIIGSEGLRGLPNLAPNTVDRYYAVQVRGKTDTLLPLDGRHVLVMSKDGRLRFARIHQSLTGMSEVEDARALDEQFLAEDAKLVALRAAEVLQVHLARVEQTTANYRKLEALAAKLGSVVGIGGMFG